MPCSAAVAAEIGAVLEQDALHLVGLADELAPPRQEARDARPDTCGAAMLVPLELVVEVALVRSVLAFPGSGGRHDGSVRPARRSRACSGRPPSVRVTRSATRHRCAASPCAPRRRRSPPRGWRDRRSSRASFAPNIAVARTSARRKPSLPAAITTTTPCRHSRRSSSQSGVWPQPKTPCSNSPPRLRFTPAMLEAAGLLVDRRDVVERLDDPRVVALAFVVEHLVDVQLRVRRDAGEARRPFVPSGKSNAPAMMPATCVPWPKLSVESPTPSCARLAVLERPVAELRAVPSGGDGCRSRRLEMRMRRAAGIEHGPVDPVVPSPGRPGVPATACT